MVLGFWVGLFSIICLCLRVNLGQSGLCLSVWARRGYNGKERTGFIVVIGKGVEGKRARERERETTVQGYEVQTGLRSKRACAFRESAPSDVLCDRCRRCVSGIARLAGGGLPFVVGAWRNRREGCVCGPKREIGDAGGRCQMRAGRVEGGLVRNKRTQ